MFLGLLYAVIACAIWGLIYIFPLILPEYDPVMIASARFAVYGMACLLFVPFQIKELKKLTRSDWFFAMRLAFFRQPRLLLVFGDQCTALWCTDCRDVDVFNSGFSGGGF